MLRFLAVPGLAGLLVLGGCVTPGTNPNVSPIVQVLPENIQTAVATACGFRAELAGIASLIAAFGGPSFPGITQLIVSAVCGAPVTVQGRGGVVKSVRLPDGKRVAVRGKFVR